jgi:putative membrane protein
MLKRKDEIFAKIPEAIHKIEEKSSVEVVVTMTLFSHNYRDAKYLAGCIAGLISLALILFLPVAFSPLIIIPDLLLSFGLIWLLIWAWPQLLRLLTTVGRREREVRNAAIIAFYDQGVMRTRDRTGMLVYFSVLEKKVRIIADIGIVNQVPHDEIKAFQEKLERALRRDRVDQDIGSIMEAFGNVLAEFLPAREDDLNELPDDARMIG